MRRLLIKEYVHFINYFLGQVFILLPSDKYDIYHDEYNCLQVLMSYIFTDTES